MNEAVVKNEVIEEEFSFTFKNEEFVEVKEEEIEQKPEYLLEKDIKTEPDESFDDFELNPEESDCNIEKISTEAGALSCKICQKRMPKNCLKFIKLEDDKTVLSEIFKIDGFLETKTYYVCYSHIQMIINANDRDLKFASTPFEKLLRSFNKRNKRSMKERDRKVRRKNCQVCRISKYTSELYDISSNRNRIVLMIGCILRGTHSVDHAKSFLTIKKGVTCYSDCKKSIGVVFEHLGVRNLEDFSKYSIQAMDKLMDMAKKIDSHFTVNQFINACKGLFLKSQKFPSNL
ncbi:hypothetical protein B9Z55_021171 [Caenorhabditis nigoni]|uniref:Lin-15A/B-like domain-containing protein n=1 Tax=Caenorhabditis nigoni TaxID=1611254 RepID=A0A2G5TRN3_9PELO|nr:hypothetical protein B9Z55_021171 [Caenorhabditis nigoni]